MDPGLSGTQNVTEMDGRHLVSRKQKYRVFRAGLELKQGFIANFTSLLY